MNRKTENFIFRQHGIWLIILCPCWLDFAQYLLKMLPFSSLQPFNHQFDLCAAYFFWNVLACESKSSRKLREKEHNEILFWIRCACFGCFAYWCKWLCEVATVHANQRGKQRIGKGTGARYRQMNERKWKMLRNKIEGEREREKSSKWWSRRLYSVENEALCPKYKQCEIVAVTQCNKTTCT